MKEYYVIVHKWSEASDEDVEKFPIKNCLEYKYVCMQYEYTIQLENSAISERWNKFKGIKEGDVIFLRGNNKIYAWGYAIKPRFDKGNLEKTTVNCQQIINANNHGKYMSSKYRGYIQFDDCEVFYENLEDGRNKWGQRIDIDNWRNIKDDYYEKGGEALWGTSRSPVKPISQDTAEFLITKLSGEEFKFPKDIEVNMQEKIDILKYKKQIILQGAPGTGKTYATAEIAVNLINDSVSDKRQALMDRYQELVKEDRIFFTTFHQSMDYEEFVEGYKPITNDDRTMIYEPKDGIFKQACNKANELLLKETNYITIEKAIELLYKKFLDKDNNLDESVQIDIGSNRKLSCYNYDSGNIAYKVTYNEEAYKSDKTKGCHNISTGQLKKVYNNYNTTYKIGYIYAKSIINYMQGNLSDEGKKLIDKETLDKLQKNLSEDPNTSNAVVLIIDEINRGNISKILGELITLLEADKRTGQLNKIEATLPYTGEHFSVPSNLYIIGTMNTADRSIGHIDYALRRRFAFITLESDKTAIEYYYKDPSLKNEALRRFDIIYNFIKEHISPEFDMSDLMVGHSYFMANDIPELDMKWGYEIEPLLLEYLKDGILTSDTATKENISKLLDQKIQDNSTENTSGE